MSHLKESEIRLAVASNSISNTVELAMNYTHLGRFMEFYLSNEDVKKPKPDPEIYNLAIKRLGVDKSEVLIVEDNINGIKAAKASGAHIIEVGSVEDVTISNIRKKINQINDLK